MLAVISDLHLQHTLDDGIRYRDEKGVVRSLTVDRNVSVRALRRFFSMLHRRARRCEAKRVHLILAGDIFEVHRSPRWLDSRNGLVRPVDTVEPTDEEPPANARPKKTPLQKRVETILSDITSENCLFFRDLRRFAENGVYRFCEDPAERVAGEDPEVRFVRRDGTAIPITVHYIPGNHDRLLNAWPSTRKAVRQCLGMGDEQDSFPHSLDRALNERNDSHETRVRHGHEYDAVNFPVSVTTDGSPARKPEDYRGPCFGDYATVDVATRLALAFRVHNACRLRQAGGDACRELYIKLTEFDDVRPMSELGTYLLASKEGGGDDEAEWLLPALRDVCAAARSDPFVGREVARLRLLKGLADEAIAGLDPVLGTSPAWGVYPLVQAVTWFLGLMASHVSPEDFAATESDLGGKVRLVVAGHTHYPAAVPLPGDAKRGCFYLDTGTWRTIVPHGAGCFGHLRAYTMVFVYSRRESKRIGRDDRRFETWTGHLVPKRTTLPPVAGTLCEEPKPQQVAFTKLDVERIPEDGVWFAKGAELDLHFGVDGTSCEPFCDRVRAGKSYPFTDVTAGLDQELDGEVWCRAVERDVAVDDILPWARHRLGRNRDGNFSQRAGKLVMEDAKTRMVLHYRVGPA